MQHRLSEEEEEVPPEAGSEPQEDPASPAPEPEGSEDSFATDAGGEGTLLDQLLARVAAEAISNEAPWAMPLNLGMR